ncbi:MAG TPA: peptidoglycan-binding domain-containing protein [Dongiaceae bacterium]|jgi:peptidoglycan hydrolase-like protein with peptidoglycan-binding domain|nr:peptidoglycan-binding domain-containing protein [Dongiaceae bacterium]
MPRDLPPTYPGERAIVRAEQRREGWAGFGAAAVIAGVAVASWLVLSAPQSASSLAESVVPAADAATLFTTQQAVEDGKNVVLTAADETARLPLTTDDVVKVQKRLKSLGFNPGKADGMAGPHTMKALNDYRKSLGLQPVAEIDRPAVAPLLP